ncbi:hypothetical protein HDU93_008829 [Gonapodya sp. JEL0774]|nr:hypothetical protein HDU93_008829 [Gonapodya sp. JEL0774]
MSDLGNVNGRLIEAVETGNLFGVQRALRDGADPRTARKQVTYMVTLTPDENGVTQVVKDTRDAEPVLALAIRGGNAMIVRRLLERGWDPTQAMEAEHFAIIIPHVQQWTRAEWEQSAARRWDGLGEDYSYRQFASYLEFSLASSVLESQPHAWQWPFNKVGSHVVHKDPDSWQDVFDYWKLEPSLEIVQLLLIYGAQVGPKELDRATWLRDGIDAWGLHVQKRPEFLHFLERGVDANAWALNRAHLVRQHPIGKGGFGEVFYSTYQPNESNPAIAVAEKCLNAGNASSVYNFFNEVNTWWRLQHKNVLRLIGACWDSKEPVLVSEYMVNDNLKQFILKHKDVLEEGDLRRVILDIAEGLHYLHNLQPGIIHTDVKPQNVLIDINGGACICDFGFAKFDDEGPHEGTSRRPGTAGYFPPERLAGGSSTKEGDVYAFGKTVYVMWKLKLSENYDPWIPVVDPMPPAIPADIQLLIKKCVEEDPTRRPSFGAILRFLERGKPEELG